MGSTLYSYSARVSRATTDGFYTKSPDQIFTQSKERKIHESMDPSKKRLREARDSSVHPRSVPIILGLDETGSMRRIPHYLVQHGLPKIMAGIIQKGIPDPALLFIALGDHECDHFPLQVGEFESGDLELDTWLTRSFLEGGGGGNAGESYLLAWYYAAYHTVTDAWDKRKEKGFLITIGDEPNLQYLPANTINALVNESHQAGFSADKLLTEAQKKYDVYHIVCMDGSSGPKSLEGWKELLGDKCIAAPTQEDIAGIISDIITSRKSIIEVNIPKEAVTKTKPASETIIL